MKVISNILTIEVNKKEYEAMETTLTILNQLYDALPTDSEDTEQYVSDATECLSLLLRNKLDDVIIYKK